MMAQIQDPNGPFDRSPDNSPKRKVGILCPACGVGRLNRTSVYKAGEHMRTGRNKCQNPQCGRVFASVTFLVAEVSPHALAKRLEEGNVEPQIREVSRFTARE